MLQPLHRQPASVVLTIWGQEYCANEFLADDLDICGAESGLALSRPFQGKLCLHADLVRSAKMWKFTLCIIPSLFKQCSGGRP